MCSSSLGTEVMRPELAPNEQRSGGWVYSDRKTEAQGRLHIAARDQQNFSHMIGFVVGMQDQHDGRKAFCCNDGQITHRDDIPYEGRIADVHLFALDRRQAARLTLSVPVVISRCGNDE